MQPVAHVRLLANIRSGFQPKRNVQPPELSGSELSWADPDENGRLEVGRCVALDVVANMIAVFFRREPSSHPFPRVNTQPIALNTRDCCNPFLFYSPCPLCRLSCTHY